jgi:hypothetical protein
MNNENSNKDRARWNAGLGARPTAILWAIVSQVRLAHQAQRDFDEERHNADAGSVQTVGLTWTAFSC